MRQTPATEEGEQQRHATYMEPTALDDTCAPLPHAETPRPADLQFRQMRKVLGIDEMIYLVNGRRLGAPCMKRPPSANAQREAKPPSPAAPAERPPRPDRDAEDEFEANPMAAAAPRRPPSRDAAGAERERPAPAGVPPAAAERPAAAAHRPSSAGVVRPAPAAAERPPSAAAPVRRILAPAASPAPPRRWGRRGGACAGGAAELGRGRAPLRASLLLRRRRPRRGRGRRRLAPAPSAEEIPFEEPRPSRRGRVGPWYPVSLSALPISESRSTKLRPSD
eukprot:tig00000430_g629.t1